MTIEQVQRVFDELIAKNGFTLAGRTSDTGTPLYHRVWKKTVQVAWHGEQEETLEARILLSYGYPLVTIKRNGTEPLLRVFCEMPTRSEAAAVCEQIKEYFHI